MDDISSGVVDLSPTGARLQLRQPMTVGSVMDFRLSTDGGCLESRVRVLWCELAAVALDDVAADRYLCGVQFLDDVSIVPLLISGLLTSGLAMLIEDCRRAERYRLRSSLSASFARFPSVRVRDISTQGIRITVPERMDCGTVGALRFRIHGRETPVDLKAHVAWTLPGERLGTFDCGLQIDEGHQWIRAVIDELALRNELELDADTLRRKFDPLAGEEMAGLLSLVH